MDTVDTSDRLSHLRSLMKKHELDIYSKSAIVRSKSCPATAANISLRQSSQPKTVINRNTLLLVTLAEVFPLSPLPSSPALLTETQSSYLASLDRLGPPW